MRLKLWLELVLLGLALVCVGAAAAAYFHVFGRQPLGDQEQWSRFGDYFGGVVNPLIGLITVVLVVLTLRTTRQEAEMTRRQMAEQIGLLKKQEVLRDMQKRLDGVLGEWNRIMDMRAHSNMQQMSLGGGPGQVNVTKRIVREVLENRERFSDLLKACRQHAKDGNQSRYVQGGWKEAFAELIPLLVELDEYCLAYEKESGSKELTKFYKARVAPAVRALDLAGIGIDSVFSRLLGTPLPHELGIDQMLGDSQKGDW